MQSLVLITMNGDYEVCYAPMEAYFIIDEEKITSNMDMQLLDMRIPEDRRHLDFFWQEVDIRRNREKLQGKVGR